jgi:hypothetical protein
MNISEATKILSEHQRWRCGAEIPLQEPSLITRAIDVILEHLQPKTSDKHGFGGC